MTESPGDPEQFREQIMDRLQKLETHRDWFTPLHEIASEETGLTDFGDPSYHTGLNILLEMLDQRCDLNDTGKLVVTSKFLHVLKQRLLTEAMLEKNPAIQGNEIMQPLVITGLVRTGSTALHYLMAQDPHRQHLPYWLAEHPKPRPPRESWPDEADFQASQRSIDMMYEANSTLRAIHFMAADWPEECGHLMAQTFTDDFWQCAIRAPQYNAWYEGANLVPTYRRHKRLLQLIGSNEPQKPWLLKYPVHLKHLKSFLQVYPDARVIWTHRDPAEVMSSYVSLIAGFRSLNVNHVDKDDIADEQSRIWADAADRAIEVRKQYPAAQFHDIYFEDFTSDPVAAVRRAYAHFAIPWREEGAAAFSAWSDANPQGRHGHHRHSASEFRLTPEAIRERFSAYMDHFHLAAD